MKLMRHGGQESTGTELRQSRERAVSRIFRGVVTGLVGMGKMAGLLVADLLGAGGIGVQRAVQFTGALLIWTGSIIAASATPHPVRFGGRLGAMSLASFAGMGLCGLVAVAEMFESYFLDLHIFRGLDTWGLWGAIAFAMTGVLLMRPAWNSNRLPVEPTAGQ